MTGAEDARRKLVAAPADLRFAVLFSPRNQRAALTALLAVYLEIREVLQECSDKGVAHSKLAWWREEIGLLAEYRPRHPLSANLAPFLPDEFAWQAALLAIVASVETDVALPAFPQFADVERYCAGCGGALLELSAALGGARHSEALVAARSRGSGWQLAELVLQAGEHAEQGRVYFASADLHKHSVDRHIVAGVHANTGLTALLADYSGRARAFATAAAPPADADALVAARVVSGLACAHLKKFAALNYDATLPPVELSPFAQLWNAWRCARRDA
ncbi:MAG: squalene/phytoene synthase family protein [Gammaproteobacteria bacterium]|nr:squalene/phytoene synthase family protein [Gammaproteobacteria bacterium]